MMETYAFCLFGCYKYYRANIQNYIYFNYKILFHFIILSMLTAGIKLSNIHYLQALQQLAMTNIQTPNPRPKLIKIPFYNFVCSMIEIITDFAKSQSPSDVLNFEAVNFNMYFIDFFFRKHDNNRQQLHRQLYSMIKEWRKYVDHHEQARLFLSLLGPKRNSRQDAKIFLKYRKCVLKNINLKIMQEISINHEDAITMCHYLFANQMKNFVVKKINELFISLKRKLLNSAKVNGSVICQFYLTCKQNFDEMNIENLFKPSVHQKSTNKLKINNFLNPENQMKYNLSFSEQFADYYSPVHENNIVEPLHDILNNQNKRNIQSHFYNEEFQEDKIQDQPKINVAMESLAFLKRKDQELDTKKTINSYSKNRMSCQKNIRKKQVQNGVHVHYPQGWQTFLKTNDLMKKKLLGQQPKHCF